jgi:hypothetical protein
MTYDVHVTRKPHWADSAGPAITLHEWLAYVETDTELRLVGFAQVETPDGDVREESTGLTLWSGYSQHAVAGNMAWFDHHHDRITCRNPDTEIIRKMHRIASALKARVQGDKGEVYGADGVAA